MSPIGFRSCALTAALSRRTRSAIAPIAIPPMRCWRHRQGPAARLESGKPLLLISMHGRHKMGRMFLGMDAEQARIDALLEHARSGVSGTLIVSGEPVTGQSALLSY